MSILIKGVNLPSGKIGDGKVTGLLIDIPVAAKPTCEVFYETAEGGEDSIGYEIEVVEVPTPHGRLGDLDRLYKHIKAECNIYGNPTIEFEDGNKVLKIIADTRTIIEAEGDNCE